MSQRKPGRNRSGARKSRKNQKKQASPQQPQQSGQPQEAQEAASTHQPEEASKPAARRSSNRRTERRAEAQKKAKQKKQLQLVGGAVAVAVIVAVVLILVNQPSNEGLDVDYSGLAFAPPPVTAGAATPEEVNPNPQDPLTGAVLGDPDAPVTMVIYADFECPYCRIFASETQPEIIDDFVRSGDVKLEFREFPILGGDDLTDDSNTSAQTAEAVMCAAEQDAYLEYHDKLFGNQGAFSNDRLKQYADELDLDTDAFNECLDSGRYEPTLQQMRDEGRELGISATPMFLINGAATQMSDQGYDLLKRQLEAAVETAE